MATDLYTVEIQAKSTGIAAATAQMESLGKQSTLASKAVKLFGAAAAGLSVGAIFNKITQDTMNFTKSVSQLSAITGATGEDLKFYEEQAALIGKTTTLSASQAAEAFQLIASAKPDLLSSKEALAAVTKEAVTLAEAAGIDLTDAAQTVGVSLNQFGADADEASRYVNVLAAGAKFGSSQITQTADAMKNAGTAASLAGLSFEEANAGVQLLAAGGLFAAEAGTGFRQVLMKLESEAEDKFKPSVVGLATALENLADENMSLTDIMDLFGAEAAKSAATMINQAGSARQLIKDITGTSTAAEQAATNFDNMTGDVLSLGSANESLAITLGRKLEPFMRKVIQRLTDFSRKVDDFVQSEKFNDVLKAMTIGAKTLAAILAGQIAGALASTVAAFVSTTASAGLASTAMGVLRGAMVLLGGPIGIVVTALIGLYAILSDVFGFDFADFKRYFKATFEVISGYVTSFATSVTDKFQEVFEYLSGLFQPYIDIYVSAFNKILEVVSGFFASFTNGATAAINFVVTGFRTGFLNIRQFVETTKINIDAFYETMKVKATSFFDSEEETASKLATINENKQTSLQAVVDKYADMADAQVNVKGETGFLGTAFETLGTVTETIEGTFSDFVSEIEDAATKMEDTGSKSKTFSGVLDTTNTAASGLSGSLLNANTNLLDLATNINTETAESGSFNMITHAMGNAATNTTAVGTAMGTTKTAVGSTKTAMDDLKTSTDDAADAIGGADGSKGLTLAQKTFQTAVENTQTAWATLIKDTITNGKLDFGTFFDTVKSGFVTMVSEIASQNITNAIFGEGGLSGFLSNLTNGFGSIISSIASGLGGIITSFVSQLTGLNIGGTAASGGAAAAGGGGLASIGTSIAGAMGAAGQFVSGAMGTAVGTTATSVGPPTAAALAGSGFKASLATMGSKALAFMTNPLTLAVLGTALVAKMLDKGGTPTSTVGMTMAKTGGMSDANIFQTSPFSSGFAPLGFKQNGTNAEAEQAMQPFRDLDMTLTEIAQSLGYNVNLAGHTFSGYGVEGTGAGTVMGSFVEEGKVKGTPIEQQMDRYATEWVHAVGVRNGLSAQVIRDIQGSGTFEDVLANSTRMPTDVDGSHQSGLNSVPFDGYIAELHAGERVQTASQVAATDAMAAEMVGLRQNLNDLMMVVAKSVAKTARIEDRWDKNGLPPTRA